MPPSPAVLPPSDLAPGDVGGARENRAPLRRLAVAAAVLAALVGVAASDPLHEGLAAAVAAVEPVFGGHPVWGALLFVGLSAVSAAVAFVSSGALVPVALDVWGPVGTGVLLWAGWTVGGVGAYALGRWVGRPAVNRLDRTGRARRVLGRLRPDTPLPLVVLLQLALQSELSGVVLGMARYPLPRFVLAVGLVEVVFAVLTVAAGVGLMDRSPALLLAAGVLLVALVAGALAVVHRRLPPAAPPP